MLSLGDYELKILEVKDAEALYQTILENKEDLREYLDWVDKIDLDIQKAAVKKWQKIYENGLGFEAAICKSNKIVGMCGLRINRADDRADIGYWLLKSERGHGLMTKTVLEIMRLGFQKYGLNKIVIECVDDNYKSQAIPKRLGFKFDSINRLEHKLHNEYRDLYTFSMTKKEWTMMYE